MVFPLGDLLGLVDQHQPALAGLACIALGIVARTSIDPLDYTAADQSLVAVSLIGWSFQVLLQVLIEDRGKSCPYLLCQELGLGIHWYCPFD